ncbi:hypothetical protein D9615_000236 [Tricholomella constricta]|uniref:Uncharacterized protein n=1 Tax=Tricholomella constricta TaxID=117010 RepID=A0A8H5MB65_9AGAR|nr:hypothetical protein D9615_000236 [Tricholomella constricta]
MIIKGLIKGRGLRPALQGPRLRWRSYSDNATQKPRSGHAQWYADIVPAMIPIFLLGSAVYLGLQLAQQKLSHEKIMDEASVRVKELEAEVDALQEKRANQTQDVTPPLSTPVNTKKSGWW